MLDVNLNTNWTVENVIHIKGEFENSIKHCLCKKVYIWNYSAFKISKYLKSTIDVSVTTCDEIITIITSCRYIINSFLSKILSFELVINCSSFHLFPLGLLKGKVYLLFAFFVGVCGKKRSWRVNPQGKDLLHVQRSP